MTSESGMPSTPSPDPPTRSGARESLQPAKDDVPPKRATEETARPTTDPPARKEISPWAAIGISAVVALVIAAIGNAITMFIAERHVSEQARLADRSRKESTARELLTEALAVMALQEAWILQGPGSRTAKISQQKGLGEAEKKRALWLRKVEIRAVLDEAEWNSPTLESFAFLSGRRAWIIRDFVNPNIPPVMVGGHSTIHYPALISSRGRTEYCGWIERVTHAYREKAISPEGLQPMRAILARTAQPDIVKLLTPLLTQEAVDFLGYVHALWKNRATWQ
jgi:hypothetical protein